MGCSISCKICNQFSTFLHWLVEKKSGSKNLDHYLDDFIFAGEENSNNCQMLMNCFLKICDELGVPIADEKCDCKCLKFISIFQNVSITS